MAKGLFAFQARRPQLQAAALARRAEAPAEARARTESAALFALSGPMAGDARRLTPAASSLADETAHVSMALPEPDAAAVASAAAATPVPAGEAATASPTAVTPIAASAPGASSDLAAPGAEGAPGAGAAGAAAASTRRAGAAHARGPATEPEAPAQEPENLVLPTFNLMPALPAPTLASQPVYTRQALALAPPPTATGTPAGQGGQGPDLKTAIDSARARYDSAQSMAQQRRGQAVLDAQGGQEAINAAYQRLVAVLPDRLVRVDAELDAPLQMHLEALDTAAHDADALVLAAVRRTRRQLGAAWQLGKGAVAANLATAETQITTIVDSLSSRYTQTLDDAADECQGAADDACFAINQWESNAPQRYPEGVGGMSEAMHEAKRRAVAVRAAQVVPLLSERGMAAVASFRDQVAPVRESIATSVEPPLRQRVTEMGEQGERAVTDAHTEARARLRTQSREVRDTIEQMRLAARARLFARRRAARAQIETLGTRVQRDAHRETAAAQRALGASLPPSLGLYGKAVERAGLALRDAALGGAGALQQAAAAVPRGIDTTTATALSAQVPRLQRTRAALEASMGRHTEQASVDAATESQTALEEMATLAQTDAPLFAQRAERQTEGYSQMGAGIDAAVANWSQPLGQSFASYIAQVQTDLDRRHDTAVDGQPAFVTQVAEAKQPFIDWAGPMKEPTTYFAPALAQAWVDVYTRLRGRAREAGNALSSGIIDVVDESALSRALRDVTAAQGMAVRELYAEISGGRTLDETLQFRVMSMDLDSDEYDIAITYLSGNAVEGKRLELEASRGWINDDEARIEEVMRSMTQEQLNELHASADGRETVENVQGVLGGTDLAVFNALDAGKPARADALRWRDRMNEARMRGETDTLTDVAAEYSGAATYMGAEVNAEDRRRLVHAEFAQLLRDSGAVERGEVSAAALAEGAEGGDAIVEYATRSTEVLRNDWLTGMHVERESVGGVRAALLGDIVHGGEGSVAARQSGLAVEFEREGGPNMLRLDRALVDPRLNPNFYPGGVIPPETLAEARTDREAVTSGFATRFPGGGAAAAYDSPSAYLSSRIDTAFGDDTYGASIANLLLVEEVPSPQTASFMLDYAMTHESGTNEALMDRVVGRMNRDEIAEMRAYYDSFGGDLYADMGVYGHGTFGELSGDERLSMEVKLLGVPRNDEERAQVATFTAQQQRDETGGLGSLLTSGDFQDRALDYEASRLARVSGIGVARNADGTPAFSSTGGRFRDGAYVGGERAEFEASTAGATDAARAYAARVDTYANFAVNAIMVAGAVLATVLTAGGAGPLLLAAVAAGTGLTAMVARSTISGGRYGWEQAFTDLAMTLVQTLTAGLGASLGLASRGGASAVQAGMRAGLTGRISQQLITAQMGRITGSALADTLLIGAITNGLNAAGTAGLSEATWEKGFGHGLSEMLSSTLTGGFTGMLSAGIGHGLGNTATGQALQRAGPLARGFGQAGIAGVAGFGGRFAELGVASARGRYRGDLGDIFMESRDAGLMAAAQGFGEGVGEHFAESARTRRITSAAEQVNQAREERGLPRLPGDANSDLLSPLRRAAEDLVFMNQNGHFGRDAIGRAINLDHVATHAGIDYSVATRNPGTLEQDAMRSELLRHVPADQHGQFADVPIHVLPAAEFLALTRSASASAVTLIVDGHPVVVVREGASLSRLADEGPHLLQARGAATRDRTARLDEATLARWDELDLDTQLDLYRNKIELEIDAHQGIVRALEGEAARSPHDRSHDRSRIAAEIDRAEGTLRNLRARLDEVSLIGPSRRDAIASGTETRPQYLDQPARLFSKEAAADGPTARGDTEDDVSTLPTTPPLGHPEGDRDGRLFPRTPEEIDAMVARRERGNTFNTERSGAQDHNEVRLVPREGEGERGQPRVDSHEVGETITERKHSQLAEIGEDASIARINELLDTYPEGRRIADVPSNAEVLARNRERFGDDVLRGRPVLEVPEQLAPVPHAVLEHAERNGVTIIDPEGRIYSIAHPDGEDGTLRASARDPDAHADAMREALLRHLPPDQHADAAEVPIVVMPAREYEQLTGSRRGPVVTLIQDGQPVVVIREGTPISRLADEGPHLSQLHDPHTRERALSLDEAVLRRWDSLDLDTQLELYRTKIGLEIDAHQRILLALDREAALGAADPVRLAAQMDRAETTLRHLRSRLAEVEAVGPRQRTDIEAGVEARPPYLDQPARLFSKDNPPLEGAAPRPSGYADQPELRGPRLDATGASVEALRQRHEEWVDSLRRGFLEPGTLPRMATGEVPAPGRDPWHADIESAYAAYHALVQEHGGRREAGIVRNADTGEYMVVLGSPLDLRVPMEALRQETVLHYHPDYGPALYRGPSGTDLRNSAAVALQTGRPVTEFIEHGPVAARARTAFTLTPVPDAASPGGVRLQIDIEFIHPTSGEYVHQRFASRREWSEYYSSRAVAFDPDGPVYRYLMRALGLSEAQIDRLASAHRAPEALAPAPADLPLHGGRPTQRMLGDDATIEPPRSDRAPPARTVFEPFVGPSLASPSDLIARYPDAQVIAAEASRVPSETEVAGFQQQGGRFVADRFGESLPDNALHLLHVRFPLPHEKSLEMAINVPALLAAHPGQTLMDTLSAREAAIESITHLGPHALRTLRPGGEMEIVFHEASIAGEIDRLSRLEWTDPASGERYRLEPVGPGSRQPRSDVAAHSGHGIPAEVVEVTVIRLRKVSATETAGSATGRAPPGVAPGQEAAPVTPRAARLPPQALEALREAGLTDAEVARQVELLGVVFLFRGTSKGYPGNPVLQSLGITPATTDPLVATIFALESRGKGGTPVLLFGERGLFGFEIDVGNVRRVLEREVQVDTRPTEFEAAAPMRVSVEAAVEVLAQMGIAHLPGSIATPQDATRLLQNLPRLTPEQIHEFLQRLRSR